MTQIHKQSVPKLRFPEFQKNENNGLRNILFADLFSFSSGKNIKQDEASPDFETPCVRYGELYHLYGEVIKTVINRTNIPSSELRFSDGDEILLPSAGEDPLDIGSASALTLEGVAIGRTINVLKPLRESEYLPVFASYYINASLKKRISCLARGSSISNVYNSDLKTLKINLPTLPEQRKIAHFLGAVDEKIAHLSRKKALLEDYKKGCMQQLFSQKIRFKDDDGNDFPDWEEKRVSDVFQITRGQVLAVPKMTQTPEGKSSFPVYSSQTKNKGLTGYFTEYLFEDAITWTTDGANAGDVQYRSGKFYCTNVCGILLSDEGNANACVAAMLNRVTEKYVSYVGNPKLMNNVMGSIKIAFPHPAEQRKIADFLSALDRKIDLVVQELTHARSFKAGLLQQMFV